MMWTFPDKNLVLIKNHVCALILSELQHNIPYTLHINCFSQTQNLLTLKFVYKSYSFEQILLARQPV